jgi:hypothetical protein
MQTQIQEEAETHPEATIATIITDNRLRRTISQTCHLKTIRNAYTLTATYPLNTNTSIKTRMETLAVVVAVVVVVASVDQVALSVVLEMEMDTERVEIFPPTPMVLPVGMVSMKVVGMKGGSKVGVGMGMEVGITVTTISR